MTRADRHPGELDRAETRSLERALADGIRTATSGGADAGPALDDDSSLVPCVACGEPMGRTGQWHPSRSGGLHPYCASCAQSLFALP